MLKLRHLVIKQRSQSNAHYIYPFRHLVIKRRSQSNAQFTALSDKTKVSDLMLTSGTPVLQG
jgi:hypothetical protein